MARLLVGVCDLFVKSAFRVRYDFNVHVCASMYILCRVSIVVCVYIANRIRSFSLPFFLQGGGGSGGAAGGLKFTVADTCERIKEEFNFIQQQYHSWVSLSLSLLVFSLSFPSLPFSRSSFFLFSFILFFFPSLFFSICSIVCVSTSLLAIIRDDDFSRSHFSSFFQSQRIFYAMPQLSIDSRGSRFLFIFLCTLHFYFRSRDFAMRFVL